MTTSLSTLLASVPDNVWSPDSPISAADLQAAEAAMRVTFPADYRDAVLTATGEVAGENAFFVFYDAQLLLQDNVQLPRGDLQPMVIFATDGGNASYFYDPNGFMGCGMWAVFMVDTGMSRREGASFVANTLTALVERIVAGDEVGDKRAVWKGGGEPLASMLARFPAAWTRGPVISASAELPAEYAELAAAGVAEIANPHTRLRLMPAPERRGKLIAFAESDAGAYTYDPDNSLKHEPWAIHLGDVFVAHALRTAVGRLLAGDDLLANRWQGLWWSR